MKIMIISDIHGGYDNLLKVLDIFNKEKYTKLFVLGDLYSFYNTIENDYILNELNAIPNKLIVRGNCDFDMNTPDIITTTIDNKRIVLTHGHLYSNNNLINMDADYIFIGHTHIPSIININNKYIINPGSITKSREGENSFASLDNEYIYIKSLDNKVLKKEKV